MNILANGNQNQYHLTEIGLHNSTLDGDGLVDSVQSHDECLLGSVGFQVTNQFVGGRT